MVNLSVFALFLLFGVAASTPVFTGFADVDFAPSNPFLSARDWSSYYKFNDTPHVSLCNFEIVRNRRSGIDIDVVHMLYDDLLDNLYVGIQCAGICGDTDGDGNPGGIDPAGAGVLGIDFPNLCNSEQFSLMLWNNVPSDVVFLANETAFYPTFVVGVNYPMCIVDTQGVQHFLAYEWPGYKNCMWPIPKNDPNNACVGSTQTNVQSVGDIGYSSTILSQIWQTDNSYNQVPAPIMFSLRPNASNPHIEFMLGSWSKYPQANIVSPPVAYQSMRLGLQGSSGSKTDCNGEDVVYNTLWEIDWDCSKYPNGNKTVDACGVCGGDGLSCVDCAWKPHGDKTYDLCGVCGGDSTSCQDCFHIPFGHSKYDKYGICGGPGTADCFNNPYGHASYDHCGVCGGDGSSCQCLEYLGYDLTDVDYALLRATILTSMIRINDTLSVLRSIRTQLPSYDYQTGGLNLAGYIDVLHDFCDECLDDFDYAQIWFAEYLSGACDGLNCQPLVLPEHTYVL